MYLTINETLLIILFHFVTDHVFNPRWIGRSKISDFAVLFFHMMIIWIGFGILFNYLLPDNLPFVSIIAFINAITHIFVDLFCWKSFEWRVEVKESTTKYYKFWQDKSFYFTLGVIQLVHLIIVFKLYHYAKTSIN